MTIFLTKEISATINALKERCEKIEVKQIAHECADAKTASLLVNIFRFANEFDLPPPLQTCVLSLRGKSIQLESLRQAIEPETIDKLEKASLRYLRHLSTGWKEASSEESEKFKSSLNETIDTINAIVLQKTRPLLTLDSIVLHEISLLQTDCKVSVSNLSNRHFNSRVVYICAEKEQLNRFFKIVQSSLSYEPKSLLRLALEVLSQNYKRDDAELNLLPAELKDMIRSHLPNSDKVLNRSPDDREKRVDSKELEATHLRDIQTILHS